ncbi:hypothetical protein ABBQ32_010423 [Trebouxia sp. C0010 RCD-2024]
MQRTFQPCMTCAPTQGVRAFWRPSRQSANRVCRQTRLCTHHTSRCGAQHGNLKQQAELQRVKQKLWPSMGVLSPLIVNPNVSRADEVTMATGGVAQAAANATADLPPTVTFGGSFGQYDPIIAFFFYAVIATLTVLTFGVAYLSIRSWQISTDEAKERAQYSRSMQDRDSGQTSLKAKARRQPPKSKASKGEKKGFGS